MGGALGVECDAERGFQRGTHVGECWQLPGILDPWSASRAYDAGK